MKLTPKEVVLLILGGLAYVGALVAVRDVPRPDDVPWACAVLLFVYLSFALCVVKLPSIDWPRDGDKRKPWH